jgi:two-component system, OmpR family, response regulator
LIVLTFLVEDNAAIRENLIATLEELTPVKVVHACDNEAEAKRWLSNDRFDWTLAIVDLFIKQGSGLGVIKLLSDRSRQRKVVVLSNYATLEMRALCLALGADRVFDKSSELEELVNYCQSIGGAE